MPDSIAPPCEASLDLAEIEPFALGHATVDPGHRRIRWNGSSCEEMEPRVTKVLVALAQANGHVVSRDRLIHLCWDDRIVGDDAINRCVQSIRRLAKGIDPPAFRIETTARVGYSLIAEEVRPLDKILPVRRRTSRRRRKETAANRSTTLLSFGLVSLLLVGGAGALTAGGEPEMARIAIGADSPADATLASDLKVDLNQYAGSTLTDLSLVDSSRPSDFSAKVSTSREGAVTHGYAALYDGRSRDLLWSATVDVPADSGTGVRGPLAAKLGNLFGCASKISRKDGERLGTGAKRLFLAACTRMDDIADQHDADMLRKLTGEAPRFAAGWSYLALAETELLLAQEGLGRPTPATLAARHRASTYLGRAERLNPDLGTNFVAAAMLAPSSDWATMFRILEEGTVRDDDEFLLYQAEAGLLGSVGMSARSVEAARRASELKPFSVDARATLIWALIHSGAISRARSELRSAQTLWPDADELDSVRFSIELRYGDPREAKRMIDAGRASLGSCQGGDLLMRARLEPTQGNIAALVRSASTDMRQESSLAAPRLLSLAQFGAVDESYALLRQPGAVTAMRPQSEILFRPQFAAFRRDARFPALAAKLGLLQFWQKTGEWPDFCSDPDLTYDCKAEAARILRPAIAGRRAIDPKPGAATAAG